MHHVTCKTLLFAALAGSADAQVAPIPPPPPAGPVVLITDRVLDGRGGELRGARIGVANGKIASLAARDDGATIDLRGYTVLPG